MSDTNFEHAIADTDSPDIAAAKMEVLGADIAETPTDTAASEPKQMTVKKVEPTVPPSRKTARPRNYSHLERNPETLDEVEAWDGNTYKVPATMGSMYWAVLVCMYENVNRPVYPEKLIERVDEVMREHNEDSWNEYCNKTNTTVFKRGKGQREVQAIRPVGERTINNAKTLTRWKDYGKRLYERGHVLRYEYDDKMQPYFKLHTNLDCLKPKKKEPTAPVLTASATAPTTENAA